jgi:hypothetical protein
LSLPCTINAMSTASRGRIASVDGSLTNTERSLTIVQADTLGERFIQKEWGSSLRIDRGLLKGVELARKEGPVTAGYHSLDQMRMITSVLFRAHRTYYLATATVRYGSQLAGPTIVFPTK